MIDDGSTRGDNDLHASLNGKGGLLSIEGTDKTLYLKFDAQGQCVGVLETALDAPDYAAEGWNPSALIQTQYGEISVSVDQGIASYTYKQTQAFTHLEEGKVHDAEQHDESSSAYGEGGPAESLTVTVTTEDGLSSTSSIDISILDDGPAVEAHDAHHDKASYTAKGSIAIDFGADGPAVEGSPDVQFTWTYKTAEEHREQKFNQHQLPDGVTLTATGTVTDVFVQHGDVSWHLIGQGVCSVIKTIQTQETVTGEDGHAYEVTRTEVQTAHVTVQVEWGWGDWNWPDDDNVLDRVNWDEAQSNTTYDWTETWTETVEHSIALDETDDGTWTARVEHAGEGYTITVHEPDNTHSDYTYTVDYEGSELGGDKNIVGELTVTATDGDRDVATDSASVTIVGGCKVEIGHDPQGDDLFAGDTISQTGSYEHVAASGDTGPSAEHGHILSSDYNVCFILDVSGSMNEKVNGYGSQTRLQAAQESIINFITDNVVNNNDFVGHMDLTVGLFGTTNIKNIELKIDKTADGTVKINYEQYS